MQSTILTRRSLHPLPFCFTGLARCAFPSGARSPRSLSLSLSLSLCLSVAMGSESEPDFEEAAAEAAEKSESSSQSSAQADEAPADGGKGVGDLEDLSLIHI